MIVKQKVYAAGKLSRLKTTRDTYFPDMWSVIKKGMR